MRLILALAGALLTASCASAQAQPAPASADAARLMADVTYLASDELQGRALATPGGRAARDFIVERFQASGLQPFAAEWLMPFQAGPSRRLPTPVEGFNVAGVIRGTDDPGRWIIVTAHYDHEGVQEGQIFNGADDNASGTAALFELARLLSAHPPRHSVMFLALDGEERGLLGARAFVADSPIPMEAVVLNINLDMIARGDNGILWVVGTRLYPSLVPVIDALPQQPGIERRYGYDDPAAPNRSDNWVNASDQAAFHARGVPFVFFSVDEHPDYHQPTDDTDRIDATWYRGAVQTAYDALVAIDRMEQPDFRVAPATAARKGVRQRP